MSKNIKDERLGEENINTFGSKMIIVNYYNYNNIDIYFPEFDWIYYHSSYKEFLNGHVKCPYEPRYHNIGFLGEGIHNIMESENIKSKSFIVWYSMLNRCYSGKFSAYKDCSVCKEWLNYQNFADWFYENYYNVGDEVMCLDKDIIEKNNKVYGPNTCVFVPQKINTLFIKSNKIRGDYPIGVIYKDGKYLSRCKNGNNKKVYLGIFNTVNEAFNMYKDFKERLIKQIADEYKELIPDNLYRAMYNYKVEIND